MQSRLLCDREEHAIVVPPSLMASRVTSSLLHPLLEGKPQGTGRPMFICSGEKKAQERLEWDLRKDFQEVEVQCTPWKWGSDGCHQDSG